MNDKIEGALKEDFFKRIDSLTPESNAGWGNMRVEEMLAHMNDALRIALGMKDAVDTSTWFSRNITFPVAVYVLPAWPKGEVTAPELDQRKQGSKARDFYTEAEFLKKLIDVFNEREPNKIKPHPLFGPLTKQQWRYLLIKHLNHHLKQFGV